MAQHIHRAAFSRDPYWYNRLTAYFSGIIRAKQPSAHSFLPGPLGQEVANGEVFLGYLPGEASEVRLPVILFGLHMLVVGTIRTGKTTFAFWIAKQAMELP